MRWADIPGFEGSYEVSDTGVVRSKDRVTSHGHHRRGRELKLSRSSKGYMRATLSKGGKLTYEGVHRLVLLAFAGEPDDPKAHAMHLNNDTSDNRVENLQWGSNSENQAQSVRERRHHHARKTECIRGHLLERGNLRPNVPGRECFACFKARDSLRKLPKDEQLLQERADQIYEQLRSAA